MSLFQHRRAWFLIGLIAVAVALCLLLFPQVHNGSGAHWLAILPLLLVGIISPLSLLSPLVEVYIPRKPDEPILPSSFQRPPPIVLA